MQMDFPGVLKNAAHNMMATKSEGDGTWGALEFAIIQVGTDGPILFVIDKMVVEEYKLVAPVSKLVSDSTEKSVSKAARQLLLAALSSPSPSPGTFFVKIRIKALALRKIVPS